MRAGLLAAALAVVGCGGAPVVQRADALPEAPPGQAFLEVRAEPPDLEVYLDDAYHGRLDGYPGGVIRIPAGHHRVTLAKRGFYPFHGEIEASPDRPARVETRLVPEPTP